MTDQHVARAELGDRVERHQEVLLLVELLADEALRLRWFGETSHGSAFDAQSQRRTFGVEHRCDAAAVKSRIASA